MRKLISKLIVLLTSFLIVILSILFGLSQNQNKIDTKEEISLVAAPKTITLDSTKIQKGKELFIKEGCMRCHSIEGEGNPRNPLDGVGKSYDRDMLEKLIIGDKVIEKNIPKRVFKQQYKQLPPNELKALVEYMKSLS